MTSARPDTVTYVVNGWRNLFQTTSSLTEHGEKRKITLKIKPHRSENLFELQLVIASRQ